MENLANNDVAAVIRNPIIPINDPKNNDERLVEPEAE